jgi:tRNA G18 (ribose-2'-O)-methylase SpoU
VETLDGSGFFIAEGLGVVRRLLGSEVTIRSVLATPSRMGLLTDEIERRRVSAYVVEPEVLRSVVGFDLHRGIVAAADRPAPATVEAVAAQATTLAVLEGLNDHENRGAVLRSAAALGVDGIVLDPTCADPLYRRSVRVSMGAAFLLPIARATSWPGELGVLARLGFRLVALTPDPDTGAIDDLAGDDLAGDDVAGDDVAGDRVAGDRLADDPSGDGRGVGTPRAGRVAVMLGAEGPGLSPAALAAADVAVRIPMHGDVDSLNVGHAAAIAFHHFAGRARRWASLSSGR